MMLFRSTHLCRMRLPNSKRCLSWFDYFNPRTRVGCDLRKSVRRCGDCYFDPRTCVRCDWPDVQISHFSTGFNSRTLLVRRPAMQCETATRNFNPRTLLGATCNSSELRKRFLISIHAPVRAIIYQLISLIRIAHFNPRTRFGCD